MRHGPGGRSYYAMAREKHFGSQREGRKCEWPDCRQYCKPPCPEAYAFVAREFFLAELNARVRLILAVGRIYRASRIRRWTNRMKGFFTCLNT